MGIIKKISAALKGREISCAELVGKYLDAIEQNRDLNAYITVTAGQAKAAADATDKRIAAGEDISLLDGVPMSIKDNITTKGIQTTCASRILEGHVPIYDAFVWRRLKEKGAVLLGKTNLDEFGMGSGTENSCFGPTLNPHNKAHVPGGSSGGAAAAVAAGLCAYGLGTDTGGSIRQPAAFCGIVGIKPTYGAVSRFGAIAYASSFDQIGVLAPSAEDAAVVFDTISAYDEADSTCVEPGLRGGRAVKIDAEIKGRRIALIKECFNGLPEDISSAVMSAAKDYEKLGAEIIEVSVPGMTYALPVYYILACAEASSNLGRYDGIRYGHRTGSYLNINDMIMKTRTEGFGDEVKRRIMLGTYVLSSGYYDAYYKKAQNLRAEITDEFKKIFEAADVVLAPTAPSTAMKIGSRDDDPVKAYLGDILTVPVNVCGLPAINLPCGADARGLPIGMQLIGDKFCESLLFNMAHVFETACPQYSKRLHMGVEL